MKFAPFFIICTVCAFTIFTAQADETPATMIDKTAAIVKEYEAEGWEPLGTIRSDTQPVTLKFFVTKSAQKIMETKNFDVADDAFDQTKFETFVAQKFGNGLVYLLNHTPDWPAPEIYLILADSGEERKNQTASVFHRSRVAEVDVRRWHKIWRQENFAISETTPVHELTHILQWFSDQNDTRYQRELSANIVEVTYLRQRVGANAPLFVNYLRLSGPPPTAQQLLDPDTNKADAWRTLAYQFVTNCLDGTYQFANLDAANQEKQPEMRLAAIEKFAIDYARHPAIGDEGFAAACHDNALLDAASQPLTLDTLRHDAARALDAKNVPQDRPSR